MYRYLVRLMVASAIVVALSCSASNRPPEPHEQINPHHIQKGTPPEKPNRMQTIPIHLSIGSFDPLLEKSPGLISPEGIIQNYEENENGYYILQFKGPVLQQWKDEVIAAGASFFDYIPKFAFLVRMNTATLRTVRELDPVRWVGIYQPAYRIAPDLTAFIQEKYNQPIDINVSVFRGEDFAVISAKIEPIGGEILDVSDRKQKLKLKIPANRIPSLSRLTGIKYIEQVPQFRISPNPIKKGGD